MAISVQPHIKCYLKFLILKGKYTGTLVLIKNLSTLLIKHKEQQLHCWSISHSHSPGADQSFYGKHAVRGASENKKAHDINLKWLLPDRYITFLL